MPGDRIPPLSIAPSGDGHHTPFETMNKVVAAANAAYSKDSIGGSPVYGIMPEWFVHEWEDFVKLKPEAAAWDQRRIQSTMEALWLLDPEDLV